MEMKRVSPLGEQKRAMSERQPTQDDKSIVYLHMKIEVFIATGIGHP